MKFEIIFTCVEAQCLKRNLEPWKFWFLQASGNCSELATISKIIGFVSYYYYVQCASKTCIRRYWIGTPEYHSRLCLLLSCCYILPCPVRILNLIENYQACWRSILVIGPSACKFDWTTMLSSSSLCLLQMLSTNYCILMEQKLGHALMYLSRIIV